MQNAGGTLFYTDATLLPKRLRLSCCLVQQRSQWLSFLFDHVGPSTRQQLDELLSLASKGNAKEEMKKVAKYSWETQGAWTVPCMVAYKVPPEDTEKVSKEEREKDMFMTCDRFGMMAYL